jgi:hypothetical protein
MLLFHEIARGWVIDALNERNKLQDVNIRFVKPHIACRSKLLNRLRSLKSQ